MYDRFAIVATWMKRFVKMEFLYSYVDSCVEAGIIGRFLYDISIHILIIQVINNIILAEIRLEIHVRDVRGGH